MILLFKFFDFIFAQKSTIKKKVKKKSHLIKAAKSQQIKTKKQFFSTEYVVKDIERINMKKVNVAKIYELLKNNDKKFKFIQLSRVNFDDEIDYLLSKKKFDSTTIERFIQFSNNQRKTN